MTGSPPVPPEPSADWGYYLDFDGTLVEIADRPDAVAVAPALPGLLESLRRRAGGAVAVVSGRPIAELDRLLMPLVLPAAGQHGLERRDAAGRRSATPIPRDALDAVAGVLSALADADRRLLVEDKGRSVALHYRLAPERTEEVLARARRLDDEVGPALDLLEGKCVVEFRPAGADKGSAVAAFSREPPFAGRRPVFVGDDRTDEDGFRAVNGAGGVSIRIGAPGPTTARYALPDVAALHHWIGRASEPAAPARR